MLIALVHTYIITTISTVQQILPFDYRRIVQDSMAWSAILMSIYYCLYAIIQVFTPLEDFWVLTILFVCNIIISSTLVAYSYKAAKHIMTDQENVVAKYIELLYGKR